VWSNCDYFGARPVVAALPLTPQSIPPFGVGLALLHAVPGSLFLPVLPVYDFCFATGWDAADWSEVFEPRDSTVPWVLPFLTDFCGWVSLGRLS
jgi:hypothetical protein